MKLQNTFAFKTTKAASLIFSLAIALFSATAANAASLKVLWYGQTDAYNAKISELADLAPTFDPEGDGSLEWDLTFWDPLDPAPDFSDYDVFAIGTGGGKASVFDFDPIGILNNKEAISAARGNRTFLTGQDADNHYRVIGLRPDGPFGFLVNAVNWAGSGEGMGIVSLPDGWFPTPSSKNRRWWLNDRSFLKDELEGYVSYFKTDSVVIPKATSDFPVNEGLTTAGLSNWRHSSHAAFNKDIPGYLSINDAGSRPGYSVTIVTASEADGGTLGPEPEKVPEPGSVLGLFALGALGVGSRLRKGKRQ